MDMYTHEKHLCSPDELISKMEKKNIAFELISKEEAVEYIRANNNYFKLSAYRKNYEKDANGNYIDLDFAMLKDLAIIDMRMRYVFVHMALDIEHFAKVKLLRALEEETSYDEDGYAIVSGFLDFLSDSDNTNNTHHRDNLEREIYNNFSNPYIGQIIQKHGRDFPVWAFVEVITLGDFIRFYKYCAVTLWSRELSEDYYLLLTVKELRNAAAHSNCLINDLITKDSIHKPNYNVVRALSAGSITKNQRDIKMGNVRMRQITTLLYTHNHLVTSDGVKTHIGDELHKVVERMNRNIGYYDNNKTIKTSFDFFEKIVDIFYP